MGKCEMWIGLGLGVAIGALGGIVLMNNCRKLRLKVADVQGTIADKFEEKKRKILECRMVQDLQDQIEETTAEIASKKNKVK